MIIQAPQPKVRLARYHEGNYMRGPRDADAVNRGWIKARTNLHSASGNDSQQFFMNTKLARLRRRINGGGSTSSTGMSWKGEYSPTKAYAAQNVVEFTPDGSAAGTYIALINVPAGQAPDMGYPYWTAFPFPPAGIWS